MGNLEGSVSRIPEAVPVKKKRFLVLIEKFVSFKFQYFTVITCTERTKACFYFYNVCGSVKKLYNLTFKD